MNEPTVGYAPLTDQLGHRTLLIQLERAGLLPATIGITEDRFLEAITRAIDELERLRLPRRGGHD